MVCTPIWPCRRNDVATEPFRLRRVFCPLMAAFLLNAGQAACVSCLMERRRTERIARNLHAFVLVEARLGE